MADHVLLQLCQWSLVVKLVDESRAWEGDAGIKEQLSHSSIRYEHEGVHQCEVCELQSTQPVEVFMNVVLCVECRVIGHSAGVEEVIQDGKCHRKFILELDDFVDGSLESRIECTFEVGRTAQTRFL